VILRNTPFLVYHRQSRGNTLADDWVTLEVESDQIRLIGKILEDTIRIFPGWYPKQVKMTDWIVTTLLGYLQTLEVALETNTAHLSQLWT